VAAVEYKADNWLKYSVFFAASGFTLISSFRWHIIIFVVDEN